MTKKEMIDYIEASGMVINFSRSYFNKMLRARVEEFYNDAVRFCNKWEGNPLILIAVRRSAVLLDEHRQTPDFSALKR